MKKMFFLCWVFVFALLNANNKMLIDCIHGTDSYNQNGSQTLIDFQTLFPNYELYYLNASNISGSHVLIDQIISGNETSYFSFNIPENPDSVFSLYVSVQAQNSQTISMLNGQIVDPNSEIASAFFRGFAHVDSVYAGTWSVNINNPEHELLNIRISYGKGIFKSSAFNDNQIDLNAYDLVLRIKDNTYTALIGSISDYSLQDQTALSEAFDNGLKFLNLLNFQESEDYKPFVHFYSDNDQKLDYSISFPGNLTYSKPQTYQKNDIAQWHDIQLVAGKMQEIVYEGAFKQPLNFLYFTNCQGSLSVTNQIDEPLYDIYLLKYENACYQIGKIDKLKAYENSSLYTWKSATSNEILTLWKKDWIKSAVENGLTLSEAEHLVNAYSWVENLLLRAHQNPSKIYGLYRFSENIFDRIIPCQSSLDLSKKIRYQWVMLSNICDKPSMNAFPLLTKLPNSSQSDAKSPNGLILHEYGVIDEYYHVEDRESDFFGIQVSENNINSINPINGYQNQISEYALNGVSDLYYGMNSYWFIIPNTEQNGIIRVLDYPIGVAKPLGDLGGIIMLGSSHYVNNQGSNQLFLKNCADALLHCSFFPLATDPVVPEIVDHLSLSTSPNPFNPITVISFEIAKDSELEMNIFNVKGQIVMHKEKELYKRGKYQFTWNAKDQNGKSLATGVYFCQVKTKDKEIIKKMLLLK